jgi:hypothetical protein
MIFYEVLEMIVNFNSYKREKTNADSYSLLRKIQSFEMGVPFWDVEAI